MQVKNFTNILTFEIEGSPYMKWTYTQVHTVANIITYTAIQVTPTFKKMLSSLVAEQICLRIVLKITFII